jgi:hypothetical protein
VDETRKDREASLRELVEMHLISEEELERELARVDRDREDEG